MKIGLDIDNTLFVNEPGDEDWTNPERTIRRQLPCPVLKTWVVNMYAAGRTLYAITGRGPELEEQTRAQLADAGLPIKEIAFTEPTEGPEDLDRMARRKSLVIDDLGCRLYVGDLDADREAAELAEVAFISAQSLRVLYLTLQPDTQTMAQDPDPETATGAPEIA